MNNRIFSHTLHSVLSAAKAASLALIAFTATSWTLPGQSLPVQPPIGWQQIGSRVTLTSEARGADDLNPLTRAVKRSQSRMFLQAAFMVYKTVRPINGHEYYAVIGSQRHSVTGYDANWVSRGYYGKEMALMISGNGDLVEYGPESTVGSETTSWSVGGSIGTEGSSPSASANFSFGMSFSSPDVKFFTTAGPNSLSIKTRLPGGGADINRPPSTDGYMLYPVAIFRVPQGRGLTLTFSSVALWEFQYTLPIVNDTILRVNSAVFHADFADKRLIDGNGSCLSLSGANAIVESCNNNSDLQRWSMTPGGQLQNKATGACLERSNANSNLTVGQCLSANEVGEQRFAVGTNPTTGIPGIRFTTTGNIVRSAARPGEAVTFAPPQAMVNARDFWRLQ